MHGRRITIIQGHPDPRGNRFGHALARSYANGAVKAGHTVKVIDLAHLSIPLLRTQDEWKSDPVPETLQEAQAAIAWAEHLVIFFPLWLGTMPALLKAFLEQTLRPGFAIATSESAAMWRKLLSGRSARVVVTMGMPAFVYRWFFHAHAIKGLRRNILAFCGIAPVAQSLIGSVEASDARRAKWLERMTVLGRQAR
ncbi:MAG: NAD(P)H-dependent oxidoreductase [Rhodospirillaceae bacterium]